MSLANLIKDKERQHQIVADEVARLVKERGNANPIHLLHGKFTFAQRLKFFQLKHELAQYHLLAAALATSEGCHISCGYHLKAALIYNHYLLPSQFIDQKDVVDYLLGVVDRDSILPPLRMGDLAFAAAIVPAIVLGFAFFTGALIFLNLDALKNSFIKEPIFTLPQALNAQISDKQSSHDCLLEGIGHFATSKYELAIRYFLEADIRSNKPIAEASYFLAQSLEAISPGALAHANTILFKIAKTVLGANHALRNNIPTSCLSFMWNEVNKSDDAHDEACLYIFRELGKVRLTFYKRYSGQIDYYDPNYRITISEVARRFREKLYRDKTLEPRTYNEPSMSNLQLSRNMSTAELLAYLTPLMSSVPIEYLEIAINKTDGDSEEKRFLQQLVASSGVTNNQSVSYEIKFPFAEILALLIDEENYVDLERLQERNSAKYWHTLSRLAINDKDSYKKLPAYLKNPLIQIHLFLINKKFSNESPQIIFFKDLIAGRQTLDNIHAVSSKMPYGSQKEFYDLLALLSLHKDNEEIMLIVFNGYDDWRKNINQTDPMYMEHHPSFTESDFRKFSIVKNNKEEDETELLDADLMQVKLT